MITRSTLEHNLLVISQDPKLRDLTKSAVHSRAVGKTEGVYYVDSASDIETDLLDNSRWELILYEPHLDSDGDINFKTVDDITRLIERAGHSPIVAFEPQKGEQARKTVLELCAQYGLTDSIIRPGYSKIVFNQRLGVLAELIAGKKDSLTGLTNLGTMEEILEVEFGKIKRQSDEQDYADARANALSGSSGNGKSLTYAFVDLDNLKLFNDRYGHQTANRLLMYVGDSLNPKSKYFRTTDVAARFGGDEFTLLLPGDHNQEGIVRKVNRVLDEITGRDLRETLKVQDNSEPIHASFSVGLATYPNPIFVESPSELTEAANVAMKKAKSYRAKNGLKGKGYTIFGYNGNDANPVKLSA